MELVLSVDPVMVKFVKIVLAVIAFPIIVEKVIMLVDKLFVFTVDPVILEFVSNVLAVIELPIIVEKEI